jgi:4-hydroxyphenylacetate 3-hydroxylase, reductase component
MRVGGINWRNCSVTQDGRAFRNALGEFATGVAAVTTKAAGSDPIGITVNSFSSVSLDPPLVLWCLDKKSDTLNVFENCSGFTINILNESQQDLSNRLARPGDHGLDGTATTTGSNGMPSIEGALASFECEVEARHDAGDHIIMIGRVLDFHHGDADTPLLYHRGSYGV